MIVVNDLRKAYDEHVVLKGLRLQFGPGEVHGIVGENGSGKTTFFKCLAGLDVFDGSIDYDGGLLKNDIGYLPTVPFYFSYMTGYEYLQLVCNARGIVAGPPDKVNLFDLPLRQYADTYSTGMQKKLAITGLLLQKNNVFILDEPFNGVDIASNMLIQQILLRLKALGKTIILSSHIFSTLQDACDYLHHLRDGGIVRTVTKADFHLIEDEMKQQVRVSQLIDAIYGLAGEPPAPLRPSGK